MTHALRKSARGFTIIEALILVGIIAVVYSIGSRYFQRISKARKQTEVAGRLESFGAKMTPELNTAIVELRVMEGNLRGALAKLEQTLKDVGQDPSRDPDVHSRTRTLREVSARREELEQRRQDLYVEHAKYRLAPDEDLRKTVERKMMEGRSAANTAENQYLILSRPNSVPALSPEADVSSPTP